MPTCTHYLLLIFLVLGGFIPLFAQCPATITPPAPGRICQGQSVRLQANTGTGLGYQWLRRDTTVPGAQAEPIANAIESFLDATLTGEYFVQVTSMTCPTTTSLGVLLTVNPLPATPDFQPRNSAAACSGTPFQFNITNPLPEETYVWDFGDGSPTTYGGQVSHTYQQTGSGTFRFPVTVYSRNNTTGCLSPTTAGEVLVNATPEFSAPTDSAGFNVCIADTVSADSIRVRAVLFNTQPVPNGIASYLVDFGDGSGPQTFLPEQFTATTPIRNPIPYDTTGTFPITIRARGNGCETVFTKNYQINKKPEAKFTANKDRVTPKVEPKDCVPVKVTVDSDSTSGGNVSYKWSVKNNTGQDAGASIFHFLEGTTDTSASPVMQFDVSGRYNLQLIATNSCGSDTTSQSLLIGYPEVRLNADTTSCGPRVINFSDELVQVDPNLGTIIESTYEWAVTGTGGAEFIGGTTKNSKNPQISFPNPGEYEVRLRVSNECGYSDAVEQQGATARITVNPIPAAPAITGTGSTLCAGDTTSIRPTGPGTSFVFYNVETGGSALFTGRAYNPGPLAATTTYFVATRDTKGCESTTRRSFTITVVPALANNTITQTQEQTEVCTGQTLARALTGSVPTGGNGTPLYTWQRSATGSPGDFTPAAGTNNGRDYTPPAMTTTTYFRRLVTIGDCRPDTSNVVRIQVNPPITNNTINVVSGSGAIICEGEAGPEIVGSQPAGNAVIVYESSTSGATATDFQPAAGTNNGANYTPGTLTQTTWFRRRLTTGGCTDVSPAVEITVNPKLTNNTITGDQTICSGAPVAAALVGSIPRGGSGTPVYLWEISFSGNDGDFTPAPGTNNQANYAPPAITRTTWFRRSITSGSCEPVLSNEVELTFVPQIENFTITATKTTVCEGELPTFTGPDGNRGVVYLWESSTTSATAGFNPATGNNDGRNYTPQALNQNTWYRLTIRATDTDCPPTPSNAIAITLEALPAAPAVEAANVQVCQGSSATLRVVGNGGTFEWYSTATLGDPIFYGREFVTPRLAGNMTYYVQAVSENKCVSPTRSPVTVTVTDIFADAGRDTTIIEGESFALQAKGGIQYQWSPAAGLNNAGIANPVASPTKTTTYKVLVTNELGCQATDEVTITVIPRVRVVNTFSPNQDGINETWEIENIGNFPNATVEIFNRWGNPVFKSTGAYQPWDGTFKGSPLPLATYYYIIRLDKEEKPISGSVTIIR